MIDTSEPEEKSVADGESVAKPLIPAKKEGKDDSIENEKEIVSAVMDCLAESSRARAIREPLWMDCYAFHAGDQNFYWSTNDNRFVNRDQYLASWRSKHMQNVVEGAIDQVVALLAQNRPQLVASPASGDFEDTSVAEVGTAILEKLSDQLQFATTDDLAKRQKAITGTVGIEPEWDAYAGIFDPKMEPEVVTDEDPASPTFGEQIQTGREIPVFEDGQLVSEPRGAFVPPTVHSVLELYLDPTTPFWHRARYLITNTNANKRELERQYGVKIDEADDSDVGPGPNSGGAYGTRTGILLREAADYFGSLFGRYSGGGMMRRGTTLTRFHLAPCASDPYGRLIVIAGESKILYDDVSPTRGYFRFPVFLMYHRFTGQSPYGDGIVKSLISPQRELNRTLRQMIEHRELCLRSKWVVDRACNIEKEAITSEPGEIIFFDGDDGGGRTHPVAPPQQVSPPPIPESLFPLLEGFYGAIDRISGIFEAQRGEVPTGVKTGRGLQVLQNQTAVRLSTVQRQDFTVWTEVGRYLLWLTSEHWDDSVKIRYTGRNLQPAIAAYDAANFAEPIDVRVQNDEGLPSDPADRQAVLTGLFQQGGIMYAPPEVQKLYFSLSRFNDVRRLLDEQNADEVNTRRKYQNVTQQGTPEQADYWEDHATCRRVLQKLMLQKDFYDLPPDRRALVEGLDRSHAIYLAGSVPAGPGGAPLPPGSYTPQTLQTAAAAPTRRQEGSPPKAAIPQT